MCKFGKLLALAFIDMNKINIFPGTALLLLLAFQLNAQVTLRIPSLTVQPGETINLDIQVDTFQEIVGMQFTVKWDSTVLQFLEVNNFFLPFLGLEDFGTQNTSGGQLTFAWTDDAVTGVTLADGSSIFTLVFKVVGALNSSTQVEITDFPTALEISNLDNDILAVTLENGTINVGEPVASTEERTFDFTLFQNQPNPFKTETNLTFELQKSTKARLSIFDNSGKTIFRHIENYGSGSHTISIAKDIFPTAGFYFYQLETQGGLATKKMIFVN